MPTPDLTKIYHGQPGMCRRLKDDWEHIVFFGHLKWWVEKHLKDERLDTWLLYLGRTTDVAFSGKDE